MLESVMEGQLMQVELPDIFQQKWEDLVHESMWAVGRQFGFQAFNMNPATQKSDLKVRMDVMTASYNTDDYTRVCSAWEGWK